MPTTIGLADVTMLSNLVDERQRLEKLIKYSNPSMAKRFFGLVYMDVPVEEPDWRVSFMLGHSPNPVMIPTHQVIRMVQSRIAEIDEILKRFGVTVS